MCNKIKKKVHLFFDESILCNHASMGLISSRDNITTVVHRHDNSAANDNREMKRNDDDLVYLNGVKEEVIVTKVCFLDFDLNKLLVRAQLQLPRRSHPLRVDHLDRTSGTLAQKCTTNRDLSRVLGKNSKINLFY